MMRYRSGSWSAWLFGIFARRGRKPRQTLDRGRRMRVEPLESRQMLANDFGAIAGTVFQDMTGNGLSADDPRIANTTVTLYRDTGNGALGSEDTSVATQTTGPNGTYRFDHLSAGTYFVKRSLPTGYSQTPGSDVAMIVVTPQAADGTVGRMIDSFSSTTQGATASSMGSHTDATSASAPEAMGGERDLFVNLTSAAGAISLMANAFNQQILEFTSTATASGVRTVTWDGMDNNPNVNFTGLGGQDLTSNGANVALRLSIGADLPGGKATFKIYSNAGNWSTATVDIPATGGAGTTEVLIPFNLFVPGAGSGADMTHVGAIQLNIEGNAAVDGQISAVAAVGPSVLTQDFALTLPSIDVELDKSVSAASTQVGGHLTYTIVVKNNGPLPASNATVVDNLPMGVFWANSTSTQGYGNLIGQQLTYYLGNLPVNGTATITIDALVNNQANGTLVNNAGVRVDQNETRLDNNQDSVTTTVVNTVDLAITKTGTPSPIGVNQTETYTLTVTNNGPGNATGVSVVDTLPTGLTYASATPSQGTSSVNGNIVTIAVGNLAAGSSTQIIVTATVDATATGMLLNKADVTGNETETTMVNNHAEFPIMVFDPPRAANASIAGSVYIDANNDGIKGQEMPVPGVTLTLTGTDNQGNPVNQTTTTNQAGDYIFAGLAAGTYTIQETQPAGLDDGLDTLGTAGGTAAQDDFFRNIVLGDGVNATGYNFGEHLRIFSKRQSLGSSR